ncbi:uncharacterized protein [Blastocystis hominis]|uniref:Uncharacterized protein n=1 Tax=Blastocystis hominis TaxID=12968 RepID=D8LXU0_BLAHO|nr:uncharacterized protein [Blastocystis hominis]CBK20395.2 unnamed protein product [Blastocystis hominis]|eukprot:XP_012894443.1 uncharacterized protein [Blastocystis hominis]
MWGLDINTSITRSLRRYRERSIGHGVEDGIDLTDRVVSRRNHYLFVIELVTTFVESTLLNMT